MDNHATSPFFIKDLNITRMNLASYKEEEPYLFRVKWSKVKVTLAINGLKFVVPAL